MEFIAAVMLLISITLAGYGAYRISCSGQSRIEERLSRLIDSGNVPTYREIQLLQPVTKRLIGPWISRALSFLGRLTPGSTHARLERKLEQAGRPLNLDANRFMAIKLAAVLLPALIAFAFLSGRDTAAVVFSALMWALAGAIIPELWLKRAIERRRAAIRKGLPDTLDLLTVSVEAGLAFDGAVSKVVEKTRGPLQSEFGRMLREIRMGKLRRDALKSMGKRVDVDEFHAFVTAVVQADQLGVSIGNVLRVQAAEARRKRRQRAEEAAMKAPIKMLFPLVFFVFPALFVVLLGPAAIQLIEAFRQMNR